MSPTSSMASDKGGSYSILGRVLKPKAFSERRRERTPPIARAKVNRHLVFSLKFSIVPLIILLIILTAWIAVFGSASSTVQTLPDNAFGCDANGNMWVTVAGTPSNWNPAYILSITLRFGRFSYTKAKAIDVMWDLVVGRSSQLLAVALIYRIYRRVIMIELEKESIPFAKFLSIQYHTVCWSALFTYTREIDWAWFYKSRSTKRFLSGLGLVLATLYAMLLPTWLSTMTGYQAVATPTLPIGSGASAAPSELQTCIYTITDGYRIGLWPNFCVLGGTPLSEALSQYCVEYNTCDDFTSSGEAIISSIDYNNLSYALASPLLEIVPQRQYNVFWLESINKTYTPRELQEAGTCVPQKQYQWGFSTSLLFAFMVVTCALAIWMYATWLSTFTRDDKDPTRLFGDVATALEIAAAVQQELGDNASGRPERELQQVLKQRGSMGVRSRRYYGATEEMRKLTGTVHVASIALEDCPPSYTGKGM